mmetsp:Transcript_13634/g.17441  ORF Transcript_13634/g.17441 Transcript_13634/m.17441 type:complete len:208 (-) Transcript_13634:272-895(-)
MSCLKTHVGISSKGPKISFACLDCGICKTRISNSKIESMLAPIEAQEEKVRKITNEWIRLKNNENDSFEDFVFYICYKCNEPFFGGLKSCEASDSREINASEVICLNCCAAGQQACNKHGVDFMEFKCRFCCTNIATYCCSGSTRFCTDCHKSGFSAQAKTCPGDHTCIFYGNHPSDGINGTHEFALGCAMCAGSIRALNSAFIGQK